MDSGQTFKEKAENIGESIKNNVASVRESISNTTSNITNSINEKLESTSEKINSTFSDKIMTFSPFGEEGFLQGTKDFLNSNSIIGKTVFLIFVIFIFIILFGILSRIIFYIMRPNESPYILWGMKSAQTPLRITQAYAEKNSIPLFRSKNQHDGIEFTYSFWMFVESNMSNIRDSEYKHVFHKGSVKSDSNSNNTGMYGSNNAPGVYLYTGKDEVLSTSLAESTISDDNYKILSLLIRLNVYHNSNSINAPYKYYEDVRIEGIPIKKWVHIVIRSTSQKIVDVYLNGKVVKRQRLSNVVKQNYDDLHINLNGGFDGFLSNIKYYNYAIGTLEIDNMVKKGPNLKMSGDNSITSSHPKYLSSKWYFNEAQLKY